MNCPCALRAPFPVVTKSNSFNITGLGAFVTYQLELRFENNITQRIGRKSKEHVTVTTDKGSKSCILVYYRNFNTFY